MKKLRIVLLVITLSIFSCKNDDNSSDSSNLNFDVEQQIINVFDNGIIAQVDILALDAQSFSDSVTDFQENNTLTNFQNLQNHWKSLILNWKPLETLTVGSVFLTSKIDVIDYWPIDTEQINSSIEQTESEVDLTTVQKLGGTSKGLAAIEYVLFGKDFEQYSTGDYAENYRLFLLGLSKDLVNEIEDYKNIWLANEDEFKSSLSNSVTGTPNEIVNSVVFKIDELSTLKISLPLGIEAGGVVNPSLTEANYSEFSLAIIEKEIKQIENVFTGLYTENALENGLYQQLEFYGREDLIEELTTNFDTIDAIISNINISLEEQLLTDTSVLFELKDALTKLEILVKNDVASALSIIVTFSDNDGD